MDRHPQAPDADREVSGQKPGKPIDAILFLLLVIALAWAAGSYLSHR